MGGVPACGSGPRLQEGGGREGGLHLAGSVSPMSWAGNEVPVCVRKRGLYGGGFFEGQTSESETAFGRCWDPVESLAWKNGLIAALERGCI